MQELIQQALREGAFDQAVAAARGWVAEAVDDRDAQRWLVIALRQAGQVAEARQALDAALALAPDDADLHFLQAGLLLSEQAPEQARESLARSVELNPNQLAAYVLQAHLALIGGDAEEARRLVTLAERVDPGHPQVAALRGGLLLREGQADEALKVLTAASAQAPDDAQILHTLGFAYMAKGHLAFAEQSFLRVAQLRPEMHSVQVQLAQLLDAQGRPQEALQQVQGLLAVDAGPGLRRMAGELALRAGQPKIAIDHLREAVQTMPGEPRALGAAMHAWQTLDDWGDARKVLDAVLKAQPAAAPAWRARMHVENKLAGDADDILQQWLAEVPDSVAALEEQMASQQQRGQQDAADAAARRIIELQPGHGPANLHLLAGLLASDANAALARADELLAQAEAEDSRRLLQDWRANALEGLGRFDEAVAQWSELQAGLETRRAPLPALTTAPVKWPVAGGNQQSPAAAFVFGLPGSGLERLLPALGNWFGAWRSDRFGSQPPHDAFQYLDSAGRIASGELPVEVALNSWAAGLQGRGIEDGTIIDWLPWWDNALLQVIRPHLPHARLLYAVRDPRDMLLQWLRGNIVGVPFAMTSPLAAAQWMAQALQQVVDLRDGELLKLKLMRLDENRARLAPEVLAEALNVELDERTPPQAMTSPQPPGHWRQYRKPLGEAFAVLTPLAVALGYPQD